jgi:serine/threonine protein kinase
MTLGAQDPPTIVDSTALPPVDPALPSAGSRRYEEGALLGAGGMGEVRLDRDRHIGRAVAIKRLLPALANDPDATVRFLREARVQGQLEHPAIVPVYDVGVSDELYFTMRRVRGRTLADVLSALASGEPAALERYGFRRLLSAFAQVCLAIDYAHTRGVVHRDLKPSNIMLGDFGEVYVLDWGLAKVLGAMDPATSAVELPAAPADAPATIDGLPIGTIGYMSPEQAAGEIDSVDPRSDVFSLGAILYEILCGAPMIDRADPWLAIKATCTGDFTAPSSRAPGVPPELEAAWRESVAPLARRARSARALSERIERYLDGDRDRALRSEQAREHAERAREATARAFASDDLGERRVAAREAGRALALDPEQPLARRTLSELLERLPNVLPDEARAAFDTIWALLLLVLWPFLDLESHWPYAVSVGLIISGGAFMARASRSRDPAGASHTLITLVLLTASLTAMAMTISPVLVIPVFVTLVILLRALFPGRAPVSAIAILGTLPPVLCGLLELLGVLPRTHFVEGGAFIIDPWAGIEFQPWMLYTTLLYSLLPPAISAFLFSRVRREAHDARRALHASRWQLAQILPSG